MVRKIFNNGDILYAEDVNAIAYPIVDGDDFIGHGPKVIDDYLADGSDQIKARFYNFYDRFKVSHQSGLNFSYLGGVVLLSNGSIVSISAGTISVPNNASSFIFIGSNGTVQSSSNLPNESFPLALATTASGTINGSVIDLRDKIIDRITPSTIPSQDLIPSGVGMEYWGSTLPTGWLWQDGAFYEPSTYPSLFAAIGYTYGQSGTRFKVPDRRGRFGLGAGQGSGLTNRSLGQLGGLEAVTLNTAQIPSHTHGVNDSGHNHSINDLGHNHGVNDPGHTHNPFTWRSGGDDGLTDGFARANTAFAGENRGPNAYNNFNGSNVQLIQNSFVGISIFNSNSNININSSNSGISINPQGGGGSHENMPPFIVCNYIIKI
jgi:microcystin-dependent protein